MFAVIQSGGKQYKVAENDVIKVEKLAAEVGADIDLDRVLMIGGDGAPTIGTPLVAGALVTAEVLEQSRADKIIVFKKKRRKGYRRRQGHRQEQTVLRITGISADGTKKKATAKAKAPTETAAETTATEATEVKEKPKAKVEAPAETAAETSTTEAADAKEKPKAKAKAPAGKTGDKTEAKTETKPKTKTEAKPAAKGAKEKD